MMNAMMNEQIVQDLLKSLESDDWDSRCQAVKALADPKLREQVAGRLASLLQHTDPGMRWAAARIMAEIGPAWLGNIQPLLQTLQDPDENVRLAVIDTLGEFRDSRALDALLTILLEADDQQSGVRCRIVQAIAKIGDSRAAPALVPLLTDHNNDIRLLTVQTLGQLKNKAVLDDLKEVLKDTDRSVRWAAAQAIQDIKIGSFS